MIRRVALGVLAALFFSSTFVLNRAMSLAGGHWAWAASLRFGYMTVFLVLVLAVTGGAQALRQVARVFRAHWLFWMVSGGIGFGVFYALITFSAAYAPGWVVATTWQITILATPLVLLLFGRRVPMRGLVFTAMIFIGIVLVNIEHALAGSQQAGGLAQALFGALPVLGAAFAYPIGNQLVWEARVGQNRRLPHIDEPILDNAFARVLLLTLGSIPFWVVLLLVSAPPPPSAGQWISTALVALFSGVIATSLFLAARNLCREPYEIAAVDATQSLEVIFSLLGEIIFLGGALPGLTGLIGVGLTLLGLGAYIVLQTRSEPA